MAEVLAGAERALEPRGPSAVTVGAFDGVHLGHQAILAATLEAARAENLLATAVTFDPHPVAFLGARSIRFLTSLEERVERITRSGVDLVRVVPFGQEIADLEPEGYVRDLLVGNMQARVVVVGPTHRFGRGGAGDADLLARLGEALGFGVRVVRPVHSPAGPVSSSHVRDALAEGRVDDAAAMLGYLYSLEGPIVPGWGRGRALGFPTANLAVSPDRVVPGPGIYAGVAYTALGAFPAASHVGPAPTFDREDAAVEAHLVGCADNLPKATVRLAFVRRLRDIVRFEDTDSLVRQIGEDVRATEEAVRPWMTKAP